MNASDPLAYTVYFENLPTASSTTRQVTVIDPMDPKLDIRSFRLGQIVFSHYTIMVPPNRSFFQTRLPLSDQGSNIVADISVGVDVTTGKATWTLTAIDLNTGAEPLDPNVGLLPPDVTNNVGEGYVTYTIKPVGGLPTGAVITNQAVITFENNAPINTPVATNTLDVVAPSSKVSPLPSLVSSTNVPVSWSGVDDANGSGLKSFGIYVSDNGGPYSLWLNTSVDTNNVLVTNGVYMGQPGHRYGFYSLATDYAGNTESPHTNADATVVISGNRAPVLAPVADQVVSVGTTLSLNDVVLDPGQPGATLGVSLIGAPSGVIANINGTNVVVNWLPTYLQAGTTNLVQLIITNNGVPPLITTQTFLVSIPDFADIGVGTAAGSPGKSMCLPLSLFSSAPLTDVQFLVDVPSTGFSNWNVQLASPKLCSGTVLDLGDGEILVDLSTCAGQSIQPSGQTIANLCFNVAPGLHSQAISVPVVALSATRTNNQPLSDLATTSGTLVIVGNQPYLEIHGVGLGGASLTLYGILNVTNTVQATQLPSATNTWAPVWQGLITNLVSPITVPTGTNRVMFFRALAP